MEGWVVACAWAMGVAVGAQGRDTPGPGRAAAANLLQEALGMKRSVTGAITAENIDVVQRTIAKLEEALRVYEAALPGGADDATAGLPPGTRIAARGRVGRVVSFHTYWTAPSEHSVRFGDDVLLLDLQQEPWAVVDDDGRVLAEWGAPGLEILDELANAYYHLGSAQKEMAGGSLVEGVAAPGLRAGAKAAELFEKLETVAHSVVALQATKSQAGCHMMMDNFGAARPVWLRYYRAKTGGEPGSTVGTGPGKLLELEPDERRDMLMCFLASHLPADMEFAVQLFNALMVKKELSYDPRNQKHMRIHSLLNMRLHELIAHFSRPSDTMDGDGLTELELGKLKVTQLLERARQGGLGEHLLDSAMEAEDPKRELLAALRKNFAQGTPSGAGAADAEAAAKTQQYQALATMQWENMARAFPWRHATQTPTRYDGSLDPPDSPALPWLPTEHMDVCKTLQTHADVIVQEYRHAPRSLFTGNHADVSIVGRNASEKWQYLYLKQSGSKGKTGELEADACAHFPKTCKMLEELRPVMWMYNATRCTNGRCPAPPASIDVREAAQPAGVVAFYMLAPGTVVPMHNGPTNQRLKCQLGVEVPPGVSITVGGARRTWEQGAVMSFDDSYHHSVDASRAEAPRVVFDISFWHPQLASRLFPPFNHECWAAAADGGKCWVRNATQDWALQGYTAWFLNLLCAHRNCNGMSCAAGQGRRSSELQPFFCKNQKTGAQKYPFLRVVPSQ